MGIRSVYGAKADPVRAAREALKNEVDIERRNRALRKRSIYEDNSEQAIKSEISRIFTDQTVRSRVYQFARLGKSFALMKRIVNELARPVYVVPPVRTVTPASDQNKFSDIAEQVRLDEIMSQALALAVACNTAFIQTRYVERLDRIICSVLAPDCATVIEDPDDPHRMLALIYDKRVRRFDGSYVTWHVYWDDEVTFQLDENGNVASFAKGPPGVRPHPYKRIPFVDLHAVPRLGGCYWNDTTNDDLVETHVAGSVFTSLAFRKLKARGFRSLIISGDIRAVPKGQLLDEEVPLLAPEGTQITETSEEATADNYLALVDAMSNAAAANRGISRKRMNQEDPGGGDDTGLQEQRAEMIKYARPAEMEQFEVLKLVSREYPDAVKHMSEDASMKIDYGELAHRVDPKTELEIWETRRRMGVASVLDQIKSLNPEIRTDAEAWKELESNMAAEAKYVEKRRALNVSEDANNQEPGQSPEENGAMGPKVRDREMTKDEAAAMAEAGAEEEDDDGNQDD